jgi:16S rRNA (guanine(527)-N(7))-methyltransferase RsmG
VLVEPLVAADGLGTATMRWVDLGSGGGSPAFPIRIVRPLAQLTLVEARSRKVAFLREVVRELSLSDVAVVHDRFETAASRSELYRTADLVTVRAVRMDTMLFSASHRLLREGGELALFTTGRIDPPSRDFELSRTSRLLPEGESMLVVFTAR